MEEMHGAHEPAFESWRFTVTATITTAVFLVLIGRIYMLQIVRGETYLQKSESNFVQSRRIAHPRGLVFDQAMRPLVDNRPSHDLYMTLAFLPDSEKSLRVLGRPLHWDKKRIQLLDERILDAADGAAPFVAETSIAPGTCDALRSRIDKKGLSGVRLAEDPVSPDDGCDLVIDPATFSSRKAVFARLKELMNLPPDIVEEAFASAQRKARGLGRFKPTLLFADLPFDAYARIEAALSLGELPGIDVLDSKKRRYLTGASGAHLLGFINELSASEYKEKRKEGYRLGDKIGRRGIERAYEEVLRGQDGTRRVVVDAKGRAKNTEWAKNLLGDEAVDPPVSGNSLVLSVDANMQRVAEQSFLGKAGSVVAMHIPTGFVLALASFPAYDPNEVTGRDSRRVWRKLARDPLRPLRNKALQDHYAPGSTFKAITAVAGLREGLITPTTIKHCPGYFALGRARWRCYNRWGHGAVALTKALQHSCDTYFYKLGYELQHDKLADTAKLLGFGSKPGLGVDREIPGIIPTTAYYQKRFGNRSPGLVINSSIGQGDVTVTPLQLAMAYAAIANGGITYRPQMVHEVRDPDGNVIVHFSPERRSDLGVGADLMHEVRTALSHVTEPGGTAVGLRWRRDMPELSQWVRESGVVIGGKTGTAQVVRLSKSVAHIDPKDVPYEQRDHAWFVGFAPAEDPEVVVVTMTEHGGFGGSMSAPVTAAVIKAYYDHVRGQGRYAPPDPALEGPPPAALAPAPATANPAPSSADAGTAP